MRGGERIARARELLGRENCVDERITRARKLRGRELRGRAECEDDVLNRGAKCRNLWHFRCDAGKS